VETALALCRFAHFVSLMIAFGVGAYLRAFAPASLRPALSRRLNRPVLFASLAALFSAVAWLALEAASMEGEWRFALDPDAVTDVLTGTAFGRVWQARLALALAFVAAAALTPRESWGLSTALAAALSASLGLVGHASMQDGLAGAMHRVNDATHLLAASAWFGGLIPFGLCLRLYPDGALRAAAVTAMIRYSTTGHFIVVAVIATGVVNIAMTTGALPWPPDTPYRALLATKTALVGIMVAAALFNRYYLVPRVKPGAAALPTLERTSAGQVALAAGVVALVSIFGLLDPA
jgi:putative copper resistance protein D